MLRSASLGLAVLLLLASVTPAASPDGNWPRFRGPNGTGVSHDKNIPLQWTEKDIVWKTPIPGSGNSSPIVWGDKLFLESSSDDGGKRMMLCLSTTDGKVLWSQEAPGGKFPTINTKNTHASSTPCTEGERVYGLFWDGKNVAIHAFDLGGKPQWRRDLGAYNSQHGAGASPIVHEGKVFLNHDQDGKASMVALDAKTGEVAWEKKREAFRACYSTPFVLEKTDEGSELVVGSTAGLTGYNPQTGAENWSWKWEFTGMALRTVGAPLISQGLAVACSGDGKGDRNMVAVKVGGSGKLPPESLVWQKTKDTPYVPCVLAQGDYLYGVNDKGMGLCFETKTGKVMWSERLCGDVTSSPLLINGYVYVIDEGGEVAVYPAAPTFKEPLKSKVGEGVMATPAVSNGKLFIRGKSTLYCIAKK